MLHWADPKLLKNYCEAPRGAGIYIIGRKIDRSKPVVPCDDYDAYLGRWPDNLKGVYVGISESSGSGVRGRLSCHARRKGNARVRQYIDAGEELYFITISGPEIIEYEPLFIALKTSDQFEGNIRPEFERSSKRRMARIRAEMGPERCAYFDNLDMGEHGEGM